MNIKSSSFLNARVFLVDKLIVRPDRFFSVKNHPAPPLRSFLISKILFIASLLTVYLLFAFSSVALSGTLEPPDSAIDSGTGEPKPTMKTLDSIPGTWDRILPANDGLDPCHSSRFTCVMNDEAVRDNETGLVWEKSPGETDGMPGITIDDTKLWRNARFTCTDRMVGGRRGWRLPSAHELISLVGTITHTSNPALPAGHPFSNVQTSAYWSAMTDATSSLTALDVDFFNGGISSKDKTLTNYVWCVRGGLNHGDVY